MKKMCLVLFMAAALAFAAFYPTQEAVALLHFEVIHTMEPGETIFGVAKQYFKKQQQYDNIERYIYAVRVKNGMDRVFKAGDKIIVPLTALSK